MSAHRTAAPIGLAPSCPATCAPIRGCRGGCASDPTASSRSRPGKVEIGQGILTALAQIVADELDVELARVRMRPGDARRAAPTRASPRAASRCRIAASALRYVCAEARAIYPRRRRRSGWACRRDALAVEDGTIVGPGNAAHQLLGAGRRGLAGPRRHLPALRRSRPPRAASPARRRPASTSPTRCSAGRASSTICACPACCMAACCARPRRARQADVARRRGRARGCRASSRWCGTAASPASSPRPSTRPRRRSRALRAGAAWSEGETLPDEARARRRGSRASRSRPRPSTRASAATPADAARTLRRAYTRPFIAHASMAPSCAIAQWSGDRRAGLVALPGRLQSARRPRARAGAAAGAASSSSTSRAPAATATTAPTTSRSTPCCWPAPRKGGRCACSGRARTSWPGRRSAPAMAVEIEADLDARRRDRRLAPRRSGATAMSSRPGAQR